MAMIEGSNKTDVLRQEHSIAEHITTHVTDADDREVLRLRVVAELAEMSLDGLPGSSGGDAHGLVVVPSGTT